MFLTCSQTRYMVKWKYSFAAKWKRKVYNCTIKLQYLTSGFSKLWPHIPWSIFFKEKLLVKVVFQSLKFWMHLKVFSLLTSWVKTPADFAILSLILWVYVVYIFKHLYVTNPCCRWESLDQYDFISTASYFLNCLCKI